MPKVRKRDIIMVGKNRAGKSTVREQLIESMKFSGKARYPNPQSHNDYLPIPFDVPLARGLRNEILDAGFSQEFLQSKTRQARQLLRAFGDARRVGNPSYYIEKHQKTVSAICNSIEPLHHSAVFISDDVYHLSELAYFLYKTTVAGNNLAVVVVRNPNINYTDEERQYDSVWQTERILSFFNDNPENAEKAYNDFEYYRFLAHREEFQDWPLNAYRSTVSFNKKAFKAALEELRDRDGEEVLTPPMKYFLRYKTFYTSPFPVFFVENVYNNSSDYEDYIRRLLIPYLREAII